MLNTIEDVLRMKTVGGYLNLLGIFSEKDNNYKKMIYLKLNGNKRFEALSVGSRDTVQLNGIIKYLREFSRNRSRKDLEKEFIRIIKSVLYFESFNSGKIYLPKRLSPDLLYFVGVVVGDGSLPIKMSGNIRKHVVSIEKKNEIFMNDILRPLVESKFQTKWTLSERKRKDGRIIWNLYKQSKPLYRFLNFVFDLPEGKKSHIVRMPELVRELPVKRRIPFVAGVMDTDWGKSGNHFGAHMASKVLLEDIRNVLSVFNVKRPEIYRYLQKGKFVSYQMNFHKDKMKVLQSINRHYQFKNRRTINMLQNG